MKEVCKRKYNLSQNKDVKCCVISKSYLNILLNQLELIELDHFSALEKPAQAELGTQKLIKALVNDYLGPEG